MKKVRFSNEIVIYEVGSTEEHRAARDGDRERRDRERFERKYVNFVPILSVVIENRVKLLLFDHLCKQTDVIYV